MTDRACEERPPGAVSNPPTSSISSLNNPLTHQRLRELTEERPKGFVVLINKFDLKEPAQPARLIVELLIAQAPSPRLKSEAEDRLWREAAQDRVPRHDLL